MASDKHGDDEVIDLMGRLEDSLRKARRTEVREMPRNPNAEPTPGRYRHFKGGEYDVVAIATSDRDERTVIYRNATTGEWYVRRVRDWNMPTPQGEPRFTMRST